MSIFYKHMKIAKPTDWKTEPIPSQHTTIPLDRAFSPKEMEDIRRGVIPQQMEDKWFIYWEDNKLFFHRSWTGFCIYVVYFKEVDGTYKIFKADVNRNPEQYKETDDHTDAQIVTYLIDLLLLHKDVPFPIHSTSPQKQAAGLWSLVGRGMFKEYPDDT